MNEMTEGPLHQFVIERIFALNIGGIDISITNSTIWMGITVLLTGVLLSIAVAKVRVIPGKMQSVAEMGYEFVANILSESAGTGSMRYFPFVFTIFVFVLMANMIGLLPFAFTVTSHLAVTATMAFVIMFAVTIIGFVKHGKGFLRIFLPSGVPLWLAPLLVVIEIISYLTRPISLSVRLFANMMAGHTTLKVFGSFVVALGIAGIAPFIFIVALTGLELLVAFLQAYIFTILTCIYLNDALHPHH